MDKLLLLARRVTRGVLVAGYLSVIGTDVLLASLSPEFFESSTSTVMMLSHAPRKNQSHAFRPLFCAQSAQKVPKRIMTIPACQKSSIFDSTLAIRFSRSSS